MIDKPLILEHEGKPAYVVVRYEVWQDLLEQAEDAEAARAYDRAKAQRDQETVPIAVADAVLAGEHPMRVWREYRRMTQDPLVDLRHAPLPTWQKPELPLHGRFHAG